jgi:hypothetical protein
VAAHICVLRDLGHTDEAEAHESLEDMAADQEVVLPSLEKLIDAAGGLTCQAKTTELPGKSRRWLKERFGV